MTGGGDIAVTTVASLTIAWVPDTGPQLSSEADAVDLLGSLYGTGAGWVAIPVMRLSPDFFELANRKAGLFLQKLVNYRMSVAIVGDIARWTETSKPLRDFVTETQRGGQVRFAEDSQALEAMLAR